MTMLTDEQIDEEWFEVHHLSINNVAKARLFAHAIESAACADRDARIAELEQRNRDLHEDVQRFKEHALSEKDARMALERELAEVRKQMEAQKDKWLSWDAKRSALEKDAGRLDWLAVNPVDTLELFGRVTGDFTHWPKWIRGDIDAAMKKEQPNG